MSTIWANVEAKLDLFLDDPLKLDTEGNPRDRNFPIALRIESWNWAQQVLVQHTPLSKRMELVVEDGQREAVLPTDLFDVYGIYDADEDRWWWPMQPRPGSVQYHDEDDILEYWYWGGRLYLESKVPFSGHDLTLYYWAHYPRVEYEKAEGETVTVTQGQILVPGHLELALIHLCTATCLMPMEIFSSNINQFKIRIEAGGPMDNPRAQSADFHLKWYHHLVDLFPPEYTGRR